MKATDLLKEQHREVADLFKRIEKVEDNDEKSYLFDELATKLVAHDVIEREVFYPACEDKMGLTDQLGEAITEHGVIEFSLYVANEALGAADFGFKMTVLKEMVAHHVKEEEHDFFPAVEEAFSAKALEELGVAMKERFETAQKANPGVLLRANLREVLADTFERLPTSTEPKSSPRPARSAAKATKPARAAH